MTRCRSAVEVILPEEPGLVRPRLVLQCQREDEHKTCRYGDPITWTKPQTTNGGNVEPQQETR